MQQVLSAQNKRAIPMLLPSLLGFQSDSLKEHFGHVNNNMSGSST